MFAAGCLGELFTQLADEDIDNLELGLVYSVIEVVEEHFLRQGRALAEAEQLKNAVLFARKVHRLVVYRDKAGVEIDDKVPGLDCRWATKCGTGSRRQWHFVRDLLFSLEPPNLLTAVTARYVVSVFFGAQIAVILELGGAQTLQSVPLHRSKSWETSILCGHD